MASFLQETKAQNFYRLVSLLADNGSAVLRKLFMKCVIATSPSLDQHLSSNKTELEHLQKPKHILYQKQMDLLFPTNGGSDVEKFDITLLSCLLKNICGKLSPKERQEVDKLRMLRNDVLGHQCKAEVEGTDFKNLWREISQVIKDIALCCGDAALVQQVEDDIKKLWTRPKLKPVSEFTDLLLQWQRSEQDIKEDVEKKLKESEQKIRNEVEEKQKESEQKIRDEADKQQKEIRSEVDKKHSEFEVKSSARFSELLQQWEKKEQDNRYDINKQYAEVKSEIRKVEEDIRDEMDKKHTEVKSEVRNIQDVMENQYQQVQSAQEHLDKRTTALEEKMKAPKITLEEKMKAPKIDEERLRSTLLSNYKRNYSRISVNPLFEEQDMPLDELFTNVVIVEMTNDGKNTIEVPVQSYRDIFLHRDNGEKVYSVVVLGDAGSGKTVYSQQMVNKWVKSQTKLKSDQKEMDDEDEKMMACFDFLFYIPLRYVKKSETLLEVIYKSVGDDVLNQATAKHVLSECPEKTLVICDGLDEIDWYPSRDNFHMFTILTTTRPWKHDVTKGSSPRKDTTLKLRGLGENGVPELAQRLRRTYYKDEAESSVDHFLEEVEKLGLEDDLNESPLILVYLLHVWYEQKKLSTSLTSILLDVLECILQRGENKLLRKQDNLLKQDFSLSTEELKGPLVGSDHPACCKYGKLLTTSAEIAFKGLTNATKEHTLVFSDRNLQDFLTNESDNKSDHLDACLKLGLISKSEHVHILHKDHRFSFPHKLLQELFTSFHIVNNKSALTEFCKYCNTLDKVHELSNVFIFTAVLCTETALLLSNHVVDILDKDTSVLEFRSNINAETPASIRGLTQMHVSCIEEHMKLKPDETCELTMSDMYIDGWRGKTDWDVLTALLQTNTRTMKSFYFVTSRGVNLDNVRKTLQQVTEVQSLARLHLNCDIKTDELTVDYVNKILANNRQLFVLHIEGGSVDTSNLPTGLLLPTLPNLQHLFIKRVSTNRDFLHGLSELLERGVLRTLHLMEISIGDSYLDMSHLTHFYQLTLWRIKLSGALWWEMLQSMNDLRTLKELVLIHPKTPDNSVIPSRPADLHLTFVSRLHKMELMDDTSSSPVLHQILCDVGSDSQIKSFKLNWSYIPVASVRSLLSAIPSLHHIKEMKLFGINTQKQHLRLDNNRNLKILKLEYVSMFPTAWSRMFVSIKFLHNLAVLQMKNVNIPEASIKLPSHLAVTEKLLNDDGNIKLLFCGEKPRQNKNTD